jgi:RNA polymerase sigma-70 factor (ECF subfamily)
LEVASKTDAGRDVEQSEALERIAKAVDSLPEARRAVVRMHLAGYDRSEIAGLLNWSEGKTRNLLYRGLADLREQLETEL